MLYNSGFKFKIHDCLPGLSKCVRHNLEMFKTQVGNGTTIAFSVGINTHACVSNFLRDCNKESGVRWHCAGNPIFV